ncbi:MAG: AraC-like DNA-binding protein [bacterium]|jgi:AraC-like DNA-binding protein
MTKELSEKYVTTAITRVIIHFLQKRKFDISDLSQKIDYPLNDLLESDGLVPIKYELRLWKYAQEKTGEPQFGILLGKEFNIKSLGLINYLSIHQNTLSEMLLTYSKYHSLVHEEAIIQIQRSPQADILEHSFSLPGEGPGKSPSELTLACFQKCLQNIAIEPIELQEVSFQHIQPKSLNEYISFFGEGVQFNFSQLYNRLIYAPNTFDTPTKNPDLGLVKLLQDSADQGLAKKNGDNHLKEKLYQMIMELLIHEDLSITKVASKMGVSTRTLQRRLKSENLIFKEAVEDVRKKLAIGYLRDQTLNISEIAFLCGFSELAAFSRAFKRWLTVSPKEYRLSLTTT